VCFQKKADRGGGLIKKDLSPRDNDVAGSNIGIRVGGGNNDKGGCSLKRY